MNVPLFVPWITTSDKKMILKALQNPQLTDGPILREFESKLSKLIKCKFAICVSNGTSALHLALTSLGIGKGDEVIVPDLTFIATANAVLHTNATPIFADVDSSFNISPESIESKITKKTRAIIPVHFAGYPCRIKEIKRISKGHRLKIIEDCAHALGAHYNGKHVGTFGDTGCFSFYPTKNLTTIEGGMVVTDSEKIAKKVRSLRNHGISKTLMERHKKEKPWVYDMIDFGYNYRLDEVRSSLGLSQLKRFKEMTKKRIDAAKYYNKKLEKISGIEIPKYENNSQHVYHLYIIKIKKEFGTARDKIHLKLVRKKIFTTIHYKPIHQFSYFKKFRLLDKEFPNTISAYKESLTLPLFPTITQKQQDYVISNLVALKK